MKISFIIPAYNRKHVIARCLDSILAQDRSFVQEVIIVDDGSTDGTPDVVNAYLRREMPIPVHMTVLEHNQGVSAARNAGLAQARGDYVWFVDSDDFVAKGAVAHIAGILERFRPDIYKFCWKRICESEVPADFDLHFESDRKAFEVLDIRTCGCEALLRARKSLVASNAVYSLTLAQRIGFETGITHGEDGIFGIACLMESASIILEPSAYLYGYVDSSDSATSSKSERWFVSNCLAAVRHYVNYEKGSIPADCKQMLFRVEREAFINRSFFQYDIRTLSRDSWDIWRDCYRRMFIDSQMNPGWKRLWAKFLLQFCTRSCFWAIYKFAVYVQLVIKLVVRQIRRCGRDVTQSF